MLKLLLTIAATLIISVKTNNVLSDAEVRLKYTITNYTGQFLHEHVQINPETTVAISSFPVMALLAELALYSVGSTQEELLSILNLNNVDEIRSVLPKYVARFNSREDVQTALYFGAFADKSDKFTDMFKRDFRGILRGETRNINYGCPTEAAYLINEWGKNHTFTSKGEDVISQEEIPRDSGIILVSTHDLQVNWNNPFTPRGMKDIEFYVNNNNVITMPALYGDGLLKFARVDWLGCVVVEIPLKGGQYTVLLFSPNDVQGLPNLLNKLKEANCFYKAMDMLETRCITVYVPLGEVNAVVDLRKNLKQVISTSIFDPATAKFSGITRSRNPMYVSSMLHQLHLIGNAEVNDSSVPTTSPSNVCADSGDIPIEIFNRPFAYYVMDKHYNIPMISGLFYGNT